MSDHELEQAYPWIPWRTPIMVAVLGGVAHRFGCRLCIAHRGLHAAHADGLPATQEEFDRHMTEEHTQ